MTATLSFRNIRIPGIIDDLSCDIRAGSSALMCTTREETGIEIARLISGLSHPESGSVHVDGRDPATLGQDDLYLLRREVGIVPAGGGLISNLKLWENITLPLLYHTGSVKPDDEQVAVDFLAGLGYSGAIHALPAHLTLYEKRSAAMVRAFLNRPRIIIYCNCFENIPAEARQASIRVTKQFHDAGTGRISLYLGPAPDPVTDLPVDMIIRMD
jgi:ABC-type transporter Mla maintaining outer membrane lipid asymmetry ATPase subunit MlaF